MEEIVCPLCNDLYNKVYQCEHCEGIMENQGREQEYLDDYSADDPIDDNGSSCVHIFKCNKCGGFERKNVEKIQL